MATRPSLVARHSTGWVVMSTLHDIFRETSGGFEVLGLRSPAGLDVRYVPGAGLVCSSLRHDGAELLGQRGGVGEYAERGATMGIPLLHPWANRLDGPGFRAAGVEVAFPPGAEAVRLDGATGLPIHGLLSGWPAWDIVAHGAGERGARLEAALEPDRLPAVADLFPFPHRVSVSAELSGLTLRVATTLEPTGEAAVPVAFGYHPYFTVPGVSREDWEVRLPVRSRAVLDERFLPTGREEETSIPSGPLGGRTYDDLFPQLESDPVFWVEGGGRRVSVAFERGYDFAVVYAPANDAVICFEPMTAATNPFAGPYPLRWVEPGATFTATFAVTVSASAAAG
jgi:aldose 1-epimerase